MRYITFIRSLNVERRVPCIGLDEVRYVAPQSAPSIYSEQGLEWLPATKTVEHRIVPVHHICKQGRDGVRDDTYIAYSKEVEDLIRIPFKAIKESYDTIQGLYAALDETVRDSTLRRRLRYLFTGRLR